MIARRKRCPSCGANLVPVEMVEDVNTGERAVVTWRCNRCGLEKSSPPFLS